MNESKLLLILEEVKSINKNVKLILKNQEAVALNLINYSVKETENRVETENKAKEEKDFITTFFKTTITDLVKLEIIFLSRKDDPFDCPWCKKFKTENKPFLDYFMEVSVDSIKGQEYIDKYLGGSKCVPAFISLATGNHTIGYKSIDKIINELKNDI